MSQHLEAARLTEKLALFEKKNVNGGVVDHNFCHPYNRATAGQIWFASRQEPIVVS